MSSFWDSIGQDLMSGKLSKERVDALIHHLKAMDSKNDDVTAKYLRRSWMPRYAFTDYDTLLSDIQGKKISLDALSWLFSNLHDFDHANEQVIMYTENKKGDYWEKHKTFRNWMGTFKDGKWNYSKTKKELRQAQR